MLFYGKMRHNVNRFTPGSDTLLSLRVKFILIGILLLLALASTAIAANATYQAVQRFQQQKKLAALGDVRTIRPWMTIPFISHFYHIPEVYLYRSLGISDPRPPRHATLHALSIRLNRPVDQLIRQIQAAILNYRKQNPTRLKHPPPPATHKARPARKPERLRS
jgi:hypothetical protein